MIMLKLFFQKDFIENGFVFYISNTDTRLIRL